MMPQWTAFRRRFGGFLACWAALAAFFAAAAAVEVRSHPVGGRAFAAIYVCLFLLLGMFLVPAFEVPRAWVAKTSKGPLRAGAWIVVFVLPYLVYVTGAGGFRWSALGKLVALAAVPFGVFAFTRVRDPLKLNWQDMLVMIWMVAPVLFGWLRGIFTVPLNLDFLTRLFVGGVGAWAFLIGRGTDGVGFEFRFSASVIRSALFNFACFAAIGLPVGLALRFIAWNPHWRGVWAFVFDYVTIFLFVAMLEELVFRGLLQNLLENTWNSRYGSQAAASVLFGLSHILHAPFPNWRYVILATVAGWLYGSSWRGPRSLTASATTHALVDTVWRTWFTKTLG